MNYRELQREVERHDSDLSLREDEGRLVVWYNGKPTIPIMTDDGHWFTMWEDVPLDVLMDCILRSDKNNSVALVRDQLQKMKVGMEKRKDRYKDFCADVARELAGHYSKRFANM